MNAPVILRAAATQAAPALLLRPWNMEDVPALVDVLRDPVVRRWTSHTVDDDADGARWVRGRQESWAAGDRFSFAVLEGRTGNVPERLVGNVVIKQVTRGEPSAEVGYWTAAHARGRGVAPRALEALTGWAFDTFGPDGLERLELLHQVDNVASCRVAQKCRYVCDRILPASPPAFPHDGHLHIRRPDAG
ncbi:GNAT family N-acetyltransferase [Streptomyces sp. NPDC053792]|uniref:GNAT family N-acetyltransferase n=1 Tax=unclassified Streptomyces TaxID=2593676 RepID=UPI00342E075F